MMHDSLPILYSFRRCPYAIRARFALKYAGITTRIKEISLRQKAEEFLAISPKGTVPVLVDASQILEESLDIIDWALARNDPEHCLSVSRDQNKQILDLIHANDTRFVKILHQYKYPDAHPEIERTHVIDAVQQHFLQLESRLQSHTFLVTDHMTKADIALFPFVRQLARIDEDAFRSLPFPRLIKWLDYFYAHPAYQLAMKKFSVWASGPGEVF